MNLIKTYFSVYVSKQVWTNDELWLISKWSNI